MTKRFSEVRIGKCKVCRTTWSRCSALGEGSRLCCASCQHVSYETTKKEVTA